MKITIFDSVPFSLYHLGFTYWELKVKVETAYI